MLVRFNHALMSSNIGFILGLAGSVMNSCLGHQHVLNVHFGSRPKWTGKVQNTRIVFFSHPNPAYFSHPGMGFAACKAVCGAAPLDAGNMCFQPLLWLQSVSGVRQGGRCCYMCHSVGRPLPGRSMRTLSSETCGHGSGGAKPVSDHLAGPCRKVMP